MNKQEIAKQALVKTWAWATEKSSDRRNARAAMHDYARSHGIDLDNLDDAPVGTDWMSFCEDLVSTLNADDRETRECAREWSDSGWYDESSGDAASMLWFAIQPGKGPR